MLSALEFDVLSAYSRKGVAMGIIVVGGGLLFLDFVASLLMASFVLGAAGFLFFGILTILLVVAFARAVMAEAEENGSLSAFEIVAVPVVSMAIGYFAAVGNVYSMLWFANENLVSPFDVLVMMVCAFVFPFLAFTVLFKAKRGSRILAAPFFLLPTYIWTWIALNWDAIQAVAQSVKMHH